MNGKPLLETNSTKERGSGNLCRQKHRHNCQHMRTHLSNTVPCDVMIWALVNVWSCYLAASLVFEKNIGYFPE